MTDPARKALICNTFNTVATGYDKPALRYFVDSAQHLVQSLNLRGDERVLDVATADGIWLEVEVLYAVGVTHSSLHRN